MFASLTATRRRLGLGAGAMLAVGALALPGSALASVSIVSTQAVFEGNSGTHGQSTVVSLKCGAPSGGHCEYALYFAVGTAMAYEDFVGSPRNVTLNANTTQIIVMQATVMGDAQVEQDETYGLDIEEQTFGSDGARLEDSHGNYDAGTILNDDVCTVCDTGTLPAGPSSGGSTPAPPADPGADPAPADPGNGPCDPDEDGCDPGDK